MLRTAMVVALSSSLCGCAACSKMVGPELEIAQYLAGHREARARFQIPGGADLELVRVGFEHVLVKPEGEGYVAVAQVDAEGLYGGEARVSYIGLERVPFVRRGGRWTPRGALLPALQEVAALLVARQSAQAAGDPSALAKLVASNWIDERLGRQEALELARQRFTLGEEREAQAITRWIIRVEREQVEALEQTKGGARRLVLAREQGALKIASGNL